jgi:hypothetical protein
MDFISVGDEQKMFLTTEDANGVSSGTNPGEKVQSGKSYGVKSWEGI